ncbi:MAG: ROK family protein [Thiohalocapsa sp.]|jgi:fructokinase|uniref:ROK family protein n=1 Tax=Thiohalocapsa sp. TaxID=2497641 RepID=UPI0025F5F028|nr:ROK family protein [Thiohalocapsa sp.]MCG6943683.1 ROK family protein [Thiohalocapsa sp.]
MSARQSGLARIGIDLGGTKIEGAVLTPAGELTHRHRLPTPRHDYAGTLARIAELVDTLARATPCDERIGVGTPGAISPFDGRLRNANSVWLNGRTLQADLAAKLGQPVRTANDADCFALSEATDGAAAGAASVFGVIIGTGTGGGIVVHGRLLQGPNAIAGEWGHNSLPWPEPEELPGPPCYCGRRGCIETFCSGPGLAADFTAATDRHLDAAAIAAAADRGDAEAEAALQRHERRLARALASIVNVLDPEVIVLGGGLSKLGRLYRTLPPLVAEYAFSDGLATRILPPRFGDSSGVRGAAMLWTDGAD